MLVERLYQKGIVQPYSLAAVAAFSHLGDGSDVVELWSQWIPALGWLHEAWQLHHTYYFSCRCLVFYNYYCLLARYIWFWVSRPRRRICHDCFERTRPSPKIFGSSGLDVFVGRDPGRRGPLACVSKFSGIPITERKAVMDDVDDDDDDYPSLLFLLSFTLLLLP